MGGRSLTQFRYSVDKGLVDLYAVVNVGAAGAVTLEQWSPTGRSYSSAALAPSSGTGFRGVKSVTRTGTGAWTVVLSNPYQRILEFDIYSQLAGGLSAVASASINSTGTNVNSTSSPQVNIILQSSAGVAADPASGEQIVFHLTLQDSTAS